jgi:phosphatidylglycerophosphate synthase
MPSMYDLKPRFQALLRPLAGRLARAGATANQVTIAAALLSLGYGAAIGVTHGAPLLLVALPVVLLARMALNALDGMLARSFGHKSDAGFLLNEIGDVVSDAALYLPLAFVAGFAPVLVVALVVLAITVEFAGTLALGLGKARNYAGPFGKSDRAAFFGFIAAAIGLGLEPGAWLDIALGVGVLLSLATIANRARAALGA